MSLLEWTEDMSVGVPELDADHKGLIAVVNRLEASVNEPPRRNVIRQCLYDLLSYAEVHFKREERVMAACHFPGLEHRKDEHRDFVEKIRDFLHRSEEDPGAAASVVSEQLLDFLKGWFHHHVLIEDMAYCPYVKGSAAAREAARSFRAAEMWWDS